MQTFRFNISVLVAMVLLAGFSPAGAEEKGAMKKILVLTFSEGFKHSSLGLCEETLAKMGKESGVFEADCMNLWKLKPEEIDLSFLTGEKLAQYDAVFFYTTTAKDGKDIDLLTPEQRVAFLDYIKSGKGAFIGAHAASDTFYKWPEFGEIVGAYFVSHPWGANDAAVTIKVDDKNHPATRMLGDSWTIQDEIYQFKAPYSREKLRVLLSLDTTKTDMNKKNLQYGPTGDYGVAWCHEYGKGRCFFTSLGHREDVWTNPVFQAHLLGGIKWALGLED